MIVVKSLSNILLTDSIALDLETSGKVAWMSKVLLISITNSVNTTYIIKCAEFNHDDIRKFLQEIVDKDIEVVAQNAKFDVGFISFHYGVYIKKIFCTMIAHRILTNGKLEDNRKLQANLPYIYKYYIGFVPTTSADKKSYQKYFVGRSLQDTISAQAIVYAAEDTEKLLYVAAEQKKQLERYQLKYVMRLEMKVLPILIKISIRGIRFDVDKHRHKIANWKKELFQLELDLDEEIRKLGHSLPQRYKSNYYKEYTPPTQVTDLFGNTVATPKITKHATSSSKVKDRLVALNYGSGPQLMKVFVGIDAPPPVVLDNQGKPTTKSGYSFSEAGLDNWLNNYPTHKAHDLVSGLKKHKKLTKRIGTYGEKLIKCLDFDGRMRTDFKQTFAETGRLASKALLTTSGRKEFRDSRDLGVNLANIPPEVRSAFLPDKGCLFLDTDHDGQELRIAADRSKDKLLLANFIENADLHSTLAAGYFSIIFKKDIEVDKSTDLVTVHSKLTGETYTYPKVKLRNDSKTATFAVFYGATGKKLVAVFAKYIQKYWEEHELKALGDRLMNFLKKRMPQLTLYLENQLSTAHTYGYTRSSKLGRIRYFPKGGFGEIMNFPIQGTGAECMKLAMIYIDNKLEDLEKEKGEYVGHIAMPIYDQLVVNIRRKYIFEVKNDVVNLMANALSFFLEDIKGEADCNICTYWYKTKPNMEDAIKIVEEFNDTFIRNIENDTYQELTVHGNQTAFQVRFNDEILYCTETNTDSLSVDFLKKEMTKYILFIRGIFKNIKTQ